MQSHQWLFSNWAASLFQGLFMAHTPLGWCPHHRIGSWPASLGTTPFLPAVLGYSWSLLGFWEVDTEMETESFCEGKREETRLSWRSSQTLMGLTDLSAASVEVQSRVCLLDCCQLGRNGEGFVPQPCSVISHPLGRS